jgi:carbon storage regulator
MLVLARGVGQTFEIADGLIEVTVISIQGSIVRLGIKAPREISVVRQEVAHERKAKAEGNENDA